MRLVNRKPDADEKKKACMDNHVRIETIQQTGADLAERVKKVLERTKGPVAESSDTR